MTKRFGKKENKESAGILLIVLIILMPVIQAAFIVLYQMVFRKADPFPGILWNDEAVYLKLIENYARSLTPGGYWGFDANHAILGAGPAWSPAIILPYALIAKIIPAGRDLVFFCNLFFLALANGIFILFTRPDREKGINVLGFELLSVPVILYLMTNMSELYRYAIAVVLAGMVHYLYTKKGNVILKYIVIPLFILYSVQVYTFFAFAVPLYVCALIKDKKWHTRFLVSLPVTGFVTLGSYYLLHLISSNYNIGKTENLLNALAAKDFAGAVKSFLFMMKEGIFGILYLRHYFVISPLYPYSVILALALIGVGIFFSVWGKNIPEKKDDAYLGRAVAHSVALFYVMYLTLYTIVPDTFYRGTMIVVVFAMYIYSMIQREYVVRFLLLLCLLGMFFARPQYRTFMEGHYETSLDKAEWDSLASELKNVMKPDSEKGLWDNTVLMYTMEPKAICAIPAGFAENFVLTEGTFSDEPGWLFFSKARQEDSDPGWIVQSQEDIYRENREIIDKNYEIIYESDEYLLYRKTQAD